MKQVLVDGTPRVIRSLPVRGRGLKLLALDGYDTLVLSLPVRGRGLKLRP